MNSENKNNQTIEVEKNKIANIIQIVALLNGAISIMIGAGFASSDYGFQVIPFLIWVLVGTISITVLYGLSEIIQIVHEIKINSLNK